MKYFTQYFTQYAYSNIPLPCKTLKPVMSWKSFAEHFQIFRPNMSLTFWKSSSFLIAQKGIRVYWSNLYSRHYLILTVTWLQWEKNKIWKSWGKNSRFLRSFVFSNRKQNIMRTGRNWEARLIEIMIKKFIMVFVND